MSEGFIQWPGDVLPPAEVLANLVPFTRGGGTSIGGVSRNVRSDRGWWSITLDQVPIWLPAQRRTWNSIRTMLGGKAGLIAVPAWSFGSAPYLSGRYEASILSPHEDGSPFDDGGLYSQGSIDIEMAAFAPLSSTVVQLRLISASTAAGIRFSYQHALYETGPILSQTADNVFQVPVFPAIRQAIPTGAQLEVNEPTCLCRLTEDRGMDTSEGITPLIRASVAFVEAVDYWNDLARGLVA